jgi:hypothetical protein
MPWPVDDLGKEQLPRERAGFLRQLAAATGRHLK